MNKPIPGLAISERSSVGTAFVIAGMHRSGTSALARVLSLLGATLPKTLMRPGADNPKGFWESAPIADLNDALLGEFGSSWDDLLAFLARREVLRESADALARIQQVLASEFPSDGAIVIKEPRVALLLDLWIAALGHQRFSPRILITVRNPLEVAASLSARNGFSTGRALLLWLAYFLAAEKSSRNTPRAFVHYQELIEDWRGVLRSIEGSLDFQFAAWSPAAELQVDAFLSQQDRHQVSSFERLQARADVVGWVKDAYDWALEAAAGAEPDPRRIEAIEAEFRAATGIFAPLIAEQRVAIVAESEARREADRRSAEMAVERDDAVKQLRARSLQEETFRRGLAERDARIAAFDQDLQGLEDRAAALEAELRVAGSTVAQRDAHIVMLERESHDRASEIGRLQAEVAEREAHLVLTSAELTEYEARIRILIGEIGDHPNRTLREALEDLDTKLRTQALERSEDRGWERTRIDDETAALRDHILALESSVRDASDSARNEQERRTHFEQLAQSQAQFIRGSAPMFRKVRGGLWRRAGLRPLSDILEFALLSVRRGPLSAVRMLGAAHMLRGSGLFDVNYYLEQHWDVAAAGQEPILHYLTVGAAEGRNPSAAFCTEAYVSRYSDVAQARVNPLLHYLRHGRAEGRLTAPAMDVSHVAQATERPRSDDARTDPYSIRPDDSVSLEAGRGETFMERFRLHSAAPDWAGAVALINAAGGDRPVESPDVSIVIPTYGQLAYTLNCLDSLLGHRSKFSFETIVVDDVSPDATRDWIARIRAVRLHQRAVNGGFIDACNDGARVARGRWLVFLNNDTRVVDGWLDALIASFATLQDAEIVGSKLFYPDGTLQEAGGIIWRDGSAWNYGRNDDPNRPEYCYARSVDYVSGAALAITREAWRKTGGFDERYKPAYGEDSDICLKVRYLLGKRVWMQPLARVVHYEGKSSGTDVTQGVKAYQVVNAKRLFETWREQLSKHRENGDAPRLEKDRGAGKRALVVDATTPEPQKDAGSLTCVELMRSLQDQGYKVTFVAEDNLLYLPEATARLQGMGIETLYWPYASGLDDILDFSGSEFDVVFVFRVAIAAKHLPSIRRKCPGARVIFHSSDLHFVREERLAQLTGRAANGGEAAKTREQELQVISSVDATIVHSTYESQLLASVAPAAPVYVFPWILDPVGRTAPFGARAHIGFLGGYRHAPNVDAVLHFADRIWPLVHARRPDMKFIVAGSECPPELKALHGRNNIDVVGFVDDLEAFFESLRLSVAPIRYGAGIKGKVAMSLAHGVPGVVTECAAEGMGLEDGDAVIIRDDERAFAEAVIALYDDEIRWNAMSAAALLFVENTYGTALARRRIEELLALAGVGR